MQLDTASSGPAVTQYNQPGRSHMRDGASRNPAIQLPGVAPDSCRTVAVSRVEETRPHPFIQLSRDIAFVLAACQFLVALSVVAAIVWALVSGPK